MKKTAFIICLLTAFVIHISPGQGVRISEDNSDPDASSMLDVASTTKGLLIPRMTSAQRLAIGGPATGLLVYQTDGTPGFYYFNGAWVFLSQPSGTAGGDLTGSYPNPALGTDVVGSNNIADGSITNLDISNTAAILNTKISGLGSLSTLNSVAGGTGGTITDGTITDADISASANISGTKINTSFTNQFLTMTNSDPNTGQSRLQYNNDLGSAGISLFGSNFGTSGNVMRVFNNTHPTDGGAIDFITDGIIRFYIGDSPNAGNIGIGTNNPNFKLDVRGTIGNNGTLYHSDIRWKKNVEPLHESLEKALALQGVTFNWRTEEFKDMQFDDRLHIGFIAQEVEKVAPELVVTTPDGYKSVEYANVTAILIEAIKEQQKMIDELKNKVDQLEKNSIKVNVEAKLD